MIRLRADFNGLFGDVLCLSHEVTCSDHAGSTGGRIRRHAGHRFDEDIGNDGERDDLIATGVVERAPDWLACKGSVWVLRIDERGVRHESDDREQ